MAEAALAPSYAALILADDDIEITADKLTTLLTHAKVEVEPIWATLLAKALEGKNVKELLTNVGSGGGAAAAAPAAGAAAAGGAAAAEEAAPEAKKEEEKEIRMPFQTQLTHARVRRRHGLRAPELGLAS